MKIDMKMREFYNWYITEEVPTINKQVQPKLKIKFTPYSQSQ